MSQSVAVLGRQPAIGRAELESLFGANKLVKVGETAVLIEKEAQEIDFARLGGTVKLAKLLTFLPFSDWQKIEDYLIGSLPDHLGFIPEGKIKLGLSSYGIKVSPKKVNATALALKKVIKSAGRSSRIVPNNDVALNTAQVLHNQLTSPTGIELILIKDGQRTVLAQTVKVQDIEAYAARDQARPKRDARVGMLPPKLAQIIVNLANPKPNATVLDPFCGTGVVLQEALLMGFNVYGTDLEPKMIEFTEANLQWLSRQYDLEATFTVGSEADATSYSWLINFDNIACETYLGRPFSTDPKPDVLKEVLRDVDTIHRKFLQNVARQTAGGFRLVLAVPAWKVKNGFLHLPVLDHLTDLGYTRLSFVHANNDKLIYHRENQFVGRELVVLTRT